VAKFEIHALLLLMRDVKRAAWWFIAVTSVLGAGAPAGAQVWNDPRSLSLAQGATRRRAEQLADTGLADYQASAHGYVTFLAQLGEGLRTPPKVIKTDELELEVYWRAPNLSKQRIIGRRDTLLLPTDIAYHRDHLGIVQNNFPNIIRIGEGDEVRDVPHPLSPLGLREYDFALTDSFAIGAGAQRINVYEVKVRPKDDRQPRVVGAVYIDPSGGQVVRMNLGFTRAAFLDNALEELSVVLENRLVGGRFWLPSHQEVEIRRSGTWMDFPARGIIRGRWEISDYRFNLSPPPLIFTGPEIVQAPREVTARYPWKGRILDSLPPDVRAVTDADIQRVQEEVRQLVRAQALARPQRLAMSARSGSELVHVNRVEGPALGAGLSKVVGGGVSIDGRGRYGFADHQAKGDGGLVFARPSLGSIRLFGEHDFRDVGDVAERSGAMNSLAAQEFGSDYTDPYLAEAGGVRYELPQFGSTTFRFTGTYEHQRPLFVHATPVTGQYGTTIPADDRHATRWVVEAERVPSLWWLGTELAFRADARLTMPFESNVAGFDASELGTIRGALVANVERPVGDFRIVTSATVAGVRTMTSGAPVPVVDLVYLGGPVSGPGYNYHSIVSTLGWSAHAELRVPAPFPAFSLGRFGRVPARGAFAPFAHIVGVGGPTPRGFPAVGAAYLLPFDLLRIDVARGLGTNGRWTFGVDLNREFWKIL
jgi:hypothetical protein